MNYLLAKVKQHHDLFKVLSNNADLYDLPDLDDTLIYTPASLLDENQWYRYENFSQSVFATDFLRNPFSSANHSQLDSLQVPRIAYLCAVQGNNYCFQIISSSQLIEKRWFDVNELSLRINRPIVTLNKFPDAIYDKGSDILFFRKLSSANIIFHGMDQLYRTATDAETQTFLGEGFLRMNNFDHTMVKIPNRKRIALVSATLNAMSVPQKTQVVNYIQLYGTVPFSNGAFDIASEEHLKHVLYGIEERFYTTPMGNVKRLANSVIELP
ncbi:MAG: hypothetical protein EOO20_21385 [Chryseobacterium sp.]|nr:MAG: hypothetical protein EOO20_21385 [Chryseobacterium sp.]